MDGSVEQGMIGQVFVGFIHMESDTYKAVKRTNTWSIMGKRLAKAFVEWKASETAQTLPRYEHLT